MIKTVLEGVLQVERYTEGPSIDAVLVIVLLKVIIVLEDVNTSNIKYGTDILQSLFHSPRLLLFSSHAVFRCLQGQQRSTIENRRRCLPLLT